MTDGLSYAAAGVDVEAGERAVALLRASVARATRPEVVGGIGGFAGLFDASALRICSSWIRSASCRLRSASRASASWRLCLATM